MIEKPKMLRSASIVYAFDFADTLFQTKNIKVFKFLRRYICLKKCLNPNDFNIRWIIVSKGSWFYKLIMRLYCTFNGMTPSQIIVTNDILKVLKDISEQKDIITYTDPKLVSKVLYISNDNTKNGNINGNINRLTHSVIAMSTIDFWEKKFENL